MLHQCLLALDWALPGTGFIDFTDSQNRPHTHPYHPLDQRPAWIGASLPLASQPRARTLRTLLGYQLPPRAVATPRELRASAICCSVVAPAFFTCFMIGSTVPAKRSASALPASPPLPRMASRFGLPSFTPRALAAASAALVRCEISVRSGEAAGGVPGRRCLCRSQPRRTHGHALRAGKRQPLLVRHPADPAATGSNTGPE
jgi:hypothetical protein